METRRCMNCMEELSENNIICPACGADNGKIEQLAYALKCGSILHERYLIGRVLGQGGFGITYIGMDLLLNVKVAIKEYFPMGLVARDPADSSKLLWNPSQASQSQRQGGYNSFLKEARKMAKIARIPSIVRVLDIFLDNETAYIVMDYVEGITLKQKLSQDGPMSFSECLALLRPMMEDLAKVHREGMIHRDISPDNIMIQPDGSVRLLDLGAAKDMTAVQGVSSQVVAKKGFSPFEQYQSGGEIGTWTDVYALCATIYYCITGKLLQDAFDRIDKEEINFPDSLKEPLSEKNKEALRAGLEVRTKKRTQSVEELLRQLDAGETAEEAVEGTRQEGKEATFDSGRKEEIEAVSTDKGSSPIKTPKIKKGIWAALAVCLVLVAGVLITTLSGSERENHSEVAKPLNGEEETEEPESVKEREEPESAKETEEPESAKKKQSLPVMMEDSDGHAQNIEHNGYYVAQRENLTVLGSNLNRKQICTITFQDNLKDLPEAAWDVSEKQDGTVMAWVIPAENDMYDLYIGGEGGVQAPKSCKKLFEGYVNLGEINFNECFDTGKVTEMRRMFRNCKGLKQINLIKFDTSQVTDMGDMFYACEGLSQLNLSNFDTSQVTNMRGMFSNCKSLSQLDLSNFDTGQVTNMSCMFSDCGNLEQLNLSNFDTSQVTSMWEMFYNCKDLKQLDLSSFDMSKVTSDEDMLKYCPAKVSGL